jgi:hypothetical protein
VRRRKIEVVQRKLLTDKIVSGSGAEIKKLQAAGVSPTPNRG